MDARSHKRRVPSWPREDSSLLLSDVREQFNAAIGRTEDRIRGLECSLEDKVSQGRDGILVLKGKILSIEDKLQELMTQHGNGPEPSVDFEERTTDRLEGLESSVVDGCVRMKHVERKLAMLDVALTEAKSSFLAPSSQALEAMQTEGVIANLEAKVQKLEQLMQSKSSGGDTFFGQVKQLQGMVSNTFVQSVTKLESTCNGIHKALVACTEHVNQLDMTVTSVASQQQKLLQTAEDFETLRGQVDHLQAHVNSGSRDHGDHIRRIEKAMANLQSNFTDLQQSTRHHKTALEACTEQINQIDATVGSVASQQQSLLQSARDFREVKGRIEHVESGLCNGRRDHGDHLRRLEEAVACLKTSVGDVQQSVRKSEAALQAEVQRARESMSTMEDKAANVQQVVQSLQDLVQNNERSCTNSLAQVEEAIRNKVDIEELQELVGSLSQMHLELTHVQQSMDVNAGVDQMNQFKGSITSMQAQIASIMKTVDGKVDVEQLQHVRNMFASLQSRIDSVHIPQPETAAGRHTWQNKEDFAALQAKVAQLESWLQQKADVKDMHKEVQQLKEGVMAASHACSSASDRSHQLESTVNSLKKQASSLERSLQGKADVGQTSVFDVSFGKATSEDQTLQMQLQIQQVKGAASNMEMKLADLEQHLQEKAGVAQTQQNRRLISGLDARLSGFEQAMQDKADVNQLHQLKGMVLATQTQLTTVEQSLFEKVDVTDVQDLRAVIGGFRTELGNLEQALNDKASASQLQQLKSNLLFLETKVAGVEQAIPEKAGNMQLQQLREGLVNMQARLGNLLQERKITVASGGSMPAITAGTSGGGRLRLMLPGYTNEGSHGEQTVARSELGNTRAPQWPKIRKDLVETNVGSAPQSLTPGDK